MCDWFYAGKQLIVKTICSGIMFFVNDVTVRFGVVVLMHSVLGVHKTNMEAFF